MEVQLDVPLGHLKDLLWWETGSKYRSKRPLSSMLPLLLLLSECSGKESRYGIPPSGFVSTSELFPARFEISSKYQ